MKYVCFIGHRYIYNYNEIKDKLYNVIEQFIKNGCMYFTMGTHGEFDRLALKTCQKLKKIYTHIEIMVVITSLKKINPIIIHDPIFGDERYTPYDDVKTVMYEIEEVHFKRKIIVSNQKMIDNCDTVICYVDTKKIQSGAKLAMKYAIKTNKCVINLYKE